ncbi:MAG: homoserine dehydrogenase [Bacillota bacterium]|nr:homoserine dehydrogenase [Bacillota bacterium]
MAKPVHIGLLGLGTVGSGVVRILQENRASILERAGRPLELRRILVRDLHKKRAVSVSPDLLTTSPADLLDDPEIEVIVEVMGGVEPARQYLAEALRRRKHVVTANKELIAKEGHPLLDLATRSGVFFLFEASVAGGIPIVKALRDSLAANRISQLMGIINGTTNYILTRMARDGSSFEEALREAQARGYAEADPSSDVDGYDAAYKLVILASLAFGTRVPVERVYIEGIRSVTPVDIAYARELGYVVKLLAIGKDLGESVQLRVHPTLIPQEHPLAAVSDVYNAVFIEGNAVGQLMFYGRGAGDLPTGSAVVADLIEVARHLERGPVIPACSCYTQKPLLPMGKVTSQFYLRMEVLDKPGVLARIAGAFGEAEVSLASVIQKGRGIQPVTLVFVTHEVAEENLRRALDQIRRLPCVHAIKNVIRVEGERP